MQAPGAGIVKTYPRNVEGVVRQGDTKRSAARALKKQRKQEERAKMEAEIQRLKTLKRKEIESRSVPPPSSRKLRLNSSILNLNHVLYKKGKTKAAKDGGRDTVSEDAQAQ